MELGLGLFVLALAAALICQYLSISIGVGYGTTLAPLLLIAGFSPLQVIPAVLLSQLAGGVIGGLAHHRLGNINLDFRRDAEIKKRLRGLGYLPRSADSKVVFALVICGVIGVLVGMFTAVNIPQVVLKTYIGVMVLGIGLAILFRRGGRRALSWRWLIALGLVSAFNKGVSGGGYVPLVAGGQIIGGREARSSVGSTSLAVAIVCGVGFLGYLLVEGNIFWALALAVTIGSVIAAPFAALTVRKASAGELRLVIGAATALLGALTLARTYI